MRCCTCGQDLPEDGPLRVDLATNTATRGVRQAKLTPAEAEILSAFLKAPGMFLTFEQIADAVWGGYAGDPKGPTLKVYVWNLKQAIRPLGFDVYNSFAKGYGLKFYRGGGCEWRATS